MTSAARSTFLTLDGVSGPSGGPEEDASTGFAHGGRSVNYWDEKMGVVIGTYDPGGEFVIGSFALD